MRMSGGPAWIRSERYDLEAIAPAGAIPPGLSSPEIEKLMMVMLQNLLATRAKLAVRATNQKEIPALTRSRFPKTGLRLLKSQTDEKGLRKRSRITPALRATASTAGWGAGFTPKRSGHDRSCGLRRELERQTCHRQDRDQGTL